MSQLHLTIADFHDESFIENNAKLFDKYIAMRIKGIHPYNALRLVFGDHIYKGQTHPSDFQFAIERSTYYRRRFHAMLESMKLDELWNPRLSIYNLLQIVQDDTAKHTAKLKAIDTLNILAGIITVEDPDNRKPGKTLQDFYAEQEAAATSEPNTPPQTH